MNIDQVSIFYFLGEKFVLSRSLCYQKEPDSKFYVQGMTTFQYCIRAYFNHLLRAVPARSALFEKQSAFFSAKSSKSTCRFGGRGV